MRGYRAEIISEGFWRIVDNRQCCIYLIQGKKRALAIDTGMSKYPLLDFIKSLTPLPVDLLLTHAHIDHMYRCEEFGNIYIHKKEIENYTKKSQRLMDIGSVLFGLKRKNYPVSDFIPLSDGDSVDLGGVKIKCVGAFGHTCGSMLLVDEAHRAVISGDAVGSGSGVWMFLPDCTSLRDYARGLALAIKGLQPYRDYKYFSGHNEPDNSKNHMPVCYETFEDMLSLCNKILEKSIEPMPITKLPLKILFYYKYKSAAMVTRRGKIK